MLYILASNLHALSGAQLNGQPIQWQPYGRFAIPSDGLLSVSVPSRASAARRASVAVRLDPEQDYLLILWGYNGRRSPAVYTTDEPEHEPLGLRGVEKELWAYADYHGMRLGWLGRIVLPARVKVSVTGQHDHSWERFVVDVADGGIQVTPRSRPWEVQKL